MKISVRIHDVKAAREKAGPMRHPILRYTDGTRVELLPDGQRVRLDKLPGGKAGRRLRIKNKRTVRQMTDQLAKEGTRL